MAGGLLNFLAPRREQRNVLADVLRRKSMADNAPVNALAAPGGLLAIPGVPKQKSVMGGLLAASSVAPGIGDFTGPMADAHMYATDPSSRTPGNYAMSALGLLPFVPSLAGITAFHGSPHLFDNFDMSKIGTGEGAQAYGHGLYFAESPGVARAYADQLAQPSALLGDGRKVMPSRRPSASGKRYAAAPDDPIMDAAISALGASNGDPMEAIKRLDSFDDEEAIDLLRHWHETNTAPPIDPGKYFYTVDIPDEAVARMLDWDAPLSEQPEAVTRLLQEVPYAEHYGYSLSEWAAIPESRKQALKAKVSVPELPVEIPGHKALSRLESMHGDVAKASADLRAAGIPGIKYYDGVSRTQGKGTRNFVVFDDKLPKILKRE